MCLPENPKDAIFYSFSQSFKLRKIWKHVVVFFLWENFYMLNTLEWLSLVVAASGLWSKNCRCEFQNLTGGNTAIAFSVILFTVKPWEKKHRSESMSLELLCRVMEKNLNILIGFWTVTVSKRSLSTALWLSNDFCLVSYKQTSKEIYKLLVLRDLKVNQCFQKNPYEGF